MIHYLLTIEEANSHETINKTFLSTPTYISLMHSILMGVFVFLFIIIFKGQSCFFSKKITLCCFLSFFVQQQAL